MNKFSGRRILNFPAVQPSSGVSKIVLIDALILLAKDILAMRSNTFPIHRHCVREMIRQSGVIIEFLNELRNCKLTNIEEVNVVVGLSELHVTLQKVLYLLEDCARSGARIWILARSELVSDEFRMLIRSISTVFDVFRVNSVGVSPEMKDLLCLVGEQSWKVVAELELADAEIVRIVWRAVDQFKHRIEPGKKELRQVMKHLGVRSWSDCNDEIIFLEELFLSASSDDESGDSGVAFLASGLIGFLVYCRIVVFDYVDEAGNRMKECGCRSNAIDGINPNDLRCPISLEIMTDPVTIATGQTYDRSSIVKWFKSGCLICPVTGKQIDDATFVPNNNLRNIIEHFCHSKNVPFPERKSKRKQDKSKSELPFSSALAGALRIATKFLAGKLAYGSNQEKSKAAFEVVKLSKSNMFYRACLVEAGVVPWLLNLFSSSDHLVQDNVVAALLNLSKHESGKMAIVEADGLSFITYIIKVGATVEARQNAAGILFYISSVEKYRIEIGNIPEAIPALVGLLNENSHRTKKNAVVTLYGLLLHPDNHDKILAAGAVPALTNLLWSEKVDLVSDSITVLAKLAERQEGAIAILNSPAVPQLVEVLRSIKSRSGRESCVSVLLSISKFGGEKAIRLLEQMPLLIPSLYSLITEGSSQASKKARMLLNYIHRLHDPNYPPILTPSNQDHLVRAQ